MACDPNTLLNDARLFVSLTEEQRSAIIVSLLCQIAGVVVPPPDPPLAPTGLLFAPTALGLTISWTDNSGNELRFRVQTNESGAGWFDAPNGAPSDANPTGPNVTSYFFDMSQTGTGTQAGLANYVIQVRAENASGNSGWVTAVVQPSLQITDLTAADFTTQAEVNWTPTGEGSVSQHLLRSINLGAFVEITVLGPSDGFWSDSSAETVTALSLFQTIKYKIFNTNDSPIPGPESNVAQIN